MKKLFLTLVVVVAGAMSSFAQTDLVATLSHGSNLTTYSGINALTDAYAAAEDGDVITLSSGTFEAINIDKAITLRGAGMNILGVEPTILSGSDITITIPDNAVSIPTIEGITFSNKVSIVGNDLAPIHLLKCRFGLPVSFKGCNAEVVHCITPGGNNLGFSVFLMASGTSAVRIHCIGCVVRSPSTNSSNKNSQIIFDNCLIVAGLTNIYNSTLNNCIIWNDGGNALYAGNVANNCIAKEANTFSNVTGNNNAIVENIQSLFKTMKGNTSYDVNETFELTEEAAATYLGDDGKQVGIYGGTDPFNPTPTNPQVKKFIVNSNANNGKLSVTINVE